MMMMMMRLTTPLTGNKQENCGIPSHRSNNKTNVFLTFRVHNLLIGTSLLSFTKTLQKFKKKLKRFY